MAGILGDFVNPFVRNPAFDTPENNFIERGISQGIENGLGRVGENIMEAGKVKTQSFAENLPELATLALISYIIYLGYMSFIKGGKSVDVEALFSKLYPTFMVYIIFKLFWKVVLHI